MQFDSAIRHSFLSRTGIKDRPLTIALILLLLCSSFSAKAEEITFEKYTAGSIGMPVSVALGDINGDGNLDAAAIGYGGEVAWFRNDSGDGKSWTKFTVATDMGGGRSINLADINGDGHLDILAAAQSGGAVVWYENAQGDGSKWVRHEIYSSSDDYWVQAADVNGDGYMDVLVASNGTNDIVWAENLNGIGTLWNRHIIRDGFNGARSVCAADINSDGHLDVMGCAQWSYEVAYWENSAGNGSTWTEFGLDTDFERGCSVTSADIDGDGNLDIIGAGSQSRQLAWWRNVKGDGHEWQKNVVDGDVGIVCAKAADLDMNGKVDLVGAAWYDNTVNWWESMDDSGTTWTKHLVDSVSNPHFVNIGDIDGDGVPDIIAASEGEGVIYVYRNPTPKPDKGIDLVVRSIDGPTSATCGQEVTVVWAIENIGVETASGPWHDTVAITDGPQKIDLGQSVVQGPLAAGETTTHSATFTLPPAAEGKWKFKVTTNAMRDVDEGIYTVNNTKISTTTLNVVAPQINFDSGDSFAGSVGIAAGNRLAKFWQETGRALSITASFTPPNAQGRIYCGFGRTPTTASYDLASPPADVITGKTALYIPAPPAGHWVYVLVTADGAQEASFDLSIEDAVLLLSSVGLSQAGRSGDATIPLSGGGFKDGMDAFLVAGGSSIKAISVLVKDKMTGFATFALTGVAAGVYDVKISLAGQESSLPGAFTVTDQTVGPRLEARMIMPSSVRAGRKYKAWLEYGNRGDADLPAPYFALSSPQDMLMRLSPGDRWRKGKFEVLGISESMPCSILKPGEMRRIPVYFKPLSNSGMAEIKFTFLAIGTEPIDWATLEQSLRPEDTSDDAWQWVFSHLQSRIGNQWSDFLARMHADADYLEQFGQQTYRIDDLWQFELRQALGSASFPSTLAGGVDASRSARGLGLDFRRWYPGEISSRFTDGIFGFGWTHSYNYRLDQPVPGLEVRIHQPDGSIRAFSKDTDAWQGEAFDTGTLVESNGGFLLTERSGLSCTFDSAGFLKSLSDPNGHSITMSYSGDNLAGLVHSDGQSLTLHYDGGRVDKIVDDQGRETTYLYAGDHLHSVTAPDGRAVLYDYTSAPGSPTDHALTKITHPDGTTTDYTYNSTGFGWVSAIARNGTAERMDISYGDFGETSIANSAGATVHLLPGAHGEPMAVIDPLGRRVDFTYDPVTKQMVNLRLPGGQTVGYEYGDNLDLASTIDALGAKTEFTHTKDFGSLSSFKDPRGNSVSYEFDTKDNLTAIGYPGGSREQWTVDSHGDAVAWTNRRNQTVNYTYDPEGRLTRATWPDGRAFDYTYNAKGDLTSTSDSLTGQIGLTYNEREYLTKIDYPNGRWLEFQYDSAGRRTKYTTNDGFELRYEYDLLGRLKTLKDDADTTYVSYAYDALGRLSREDRGNGTYCIYDYDLASQLTGITHYSPTDEMQEKLTYTYDQNGRRSSMKNHEGEHNYTYDLTGQLTGCSAPGGAAITYVYDSVGNRQSVTDTSGTVEYHTNPLNQYLSVGATVIGHDADGNMASQTEGTESSTYEYDVLNRLVKIRKNGEVTWECAYDALGDRIRVIGTGVTHEYLHDPFGFGNAISEYDNNENIVRRYVFGITLVVDQDGVGKKRYYMLDAMANTIALTAETGAVVGQMAYEPFGSILNSNGETTPFCFVGGGGVMDDGNGLLFMMNRYYLPRSGRFIQSDQFGINTGDVNYYRYCLNAPTILVDTSGNVPHHGNWCGPAYASGQNLNEVNDKLPRPGDKGYQTPTDVLDSACQQHDYCLNEAGHDKNARNQCDQNLEEALDNMSLIELGPYGIGAKFIFDNRHPNNNTGEEKKGQSGAHKP